MDKKLSNNELTSSQYEDYVSFVLKRLDFFKKGTIHRNKKYKGVRQPGNYEIDIAIEININEALYFLIIIECKNWNRKVDRPVIQNLVQTRDAISAHKAAIVSPFGFTKEALLVAETQGIACWVIAENIFDMIMFNGGTPLNYFLHLFESLRLDLKRNLAEYIGFNNYSYQLHGFELVPFNIVTHSDEQLEQIKARRYRTHHKNDLFNSKSNYPEYLCNKKHSASEDIVNFISNDILQNFNPKIKNENHPIEQWIEINKKILIDSGMEKEEVKILLDRVILSLLNYEIFNKDMLEDLLLKSYDEGMLIQICDNYKDPYWDGVVSSE